MTNSEIAKEIRKLKSQIRELKPIFSDNDDKYRVVYRGQVLKIYDANPETLLKEASDQIKNRYKVLAKYADKVARAQLNETLATEDHQELNEHFRQRDHAYDNLRIDYREVSDENSRLEDKMEEKQAAVDNAKAGIVLKLFSRWELIKNALLFRR